MRKVTFPIMGPYTECFQYLVNRMGYEPVTPPKTNAETIKLGVRHSSNMVCFPFKSTLGNLIQGLDSGADTILAIGCSMKKTPEPCRFGYYYHIQEQILRRLGYKFDMFYLRGPGLNIINSLKRFNPKISRLQIVGIIRDMWKQIKEIEAREYTYEERDINIGIVGEAYCMWENYVNYDIVKKLRKMDVGVHMSITLSWFLKHEIGIADTKKYLEPEVTKYFPKRIGGHGYESIYNTIHYAKQGFDGVIHLLPLSCFVEDTYITMSDYTQKKIKDITINDNVLTHKGNIKRVNNLTSRAYQGEIINIDCGGLSKIKVTPDHPIFSIKRNNAKSNKSVKLESSFIKAMELKKGDYIAVPKPTFIDIKNMFSKNEIINKKIPKYADIGKFIYNLGMFRLLGYYLAEGTILQDNNKNKMHLKRYVSGVAFTFNIKETYYINDIISILQENKIDFYYKVRTHNYRTNTADLHITNRSLGNFLSKLGGRYCDKKQIHPELLNLAPNLQLEIAKGFFRGDGCLTDKYGETSYRGVTASFKLASQLYWILIRNNIKCSFLIQNIKNRKQSYMLKISNSESINRIKDENIKITNRKNNVRFIEDKTHFFIPILKMSKENYNGQVYNLEIEEDNSYVANLLAVHNCMPETICEMPINQVSDDYGIPVYRFPIDENRFEAGFDTRLETFIKLLKRKAKCTLA